MTIKVSNSIKKNMNQKLENILIQNIAELIEYESDFEYNGTSFSYQRIPYENDEIVIVVACPDGSPWERKIKVYLDESDSHSDDIGFSDYNLISEELEHIDEVIKIMTNLSNDIND